jgi:hypothetical protein
MAPLQRRCYVRGALQIQIEIEIVTARQVK